MPISAYLRALRDKIGQALVVMPAVTGLVRDAGGALLLQRRKDFGEWGLPGGAVDPGEPPAQALVREVWEETGVVCRPTAILGVLGGPLQRFTYPNGDVVEYTSIVFAAEPVAGELRPRDGESLEVRYFTDAEVAQVAGRHLAEVLAALAAPFQWDERWLSPA